MCHIGCWQPPTGVVTGVLYRAQGVIPQCGQCGGISFGFGLDQRALAQVRPNNVAASSHPIWNTCSNGRKSRNGSDGALTRHGRYRHVLLERRGGGGLQLGSTSAVHTQSFA
eukprot:CAMPEP_0174307018 /NCGR_PEP_ID=MMETSP0810-20121108/846_1 /TAXON_ID=73025 ORGANISM="Eutreptiella gymnastica-like, Strain CCMP1594" /NCGR_SAMPLE_ID=MMETSP0810 /ASSEMBLY_ACC=CAM_ASM_000659 /LENGTH=111 /DNA_ID=CAMNT_0015413943 /DNA_START=154 /DNA_END=489 /DNA_ORIENTATION=+